MYEKLTEKFLSMKWDQNYLNQLNTSISEDTVVSILDKVFSDWTFKITHMISVNGGMCVAGTLFLPGRTIDGTGSNEWSAICNIISKLTANVNVVSNNSVQPVQNASEQPKTTSASVMAELSNIKAKTQQNGSEQPKDDAQAIFDELLGGDGTPKATEEHKAETKEEEPEYLEFGTPECDAYEKKFWDQVKQADALKTPTADEVNPNRVPMKQAWTNETGNRLKEWMATHNVVTKEQMSSWFMRYCGLEYDFFNPEWLDKFITWTDALREQQTY